MDDTDKGKREKRRRSARTGANLQGQVALITGGSRGLGFVLARQLAEAGCNVAICARDEKEVTRAATLLTEHLGRSGQEGARMNGHGNGPAFPS
ncbi:MAG TPA: SDR family NAD(P)-dependent oxidoreductase, partial [Chloroflexota bacterium]|nr:SDR family NAD(P)-dependent oxidoreductase [Chloroflexota bacterium]